MSIGTLNEAYQDLLVNLDNWYETEKLRIELGHDADYQREDYHETLFEGRWYADPHRPEAVAAREAARQRKLDRDFELTNWMQHD